MASPSLRCALRPVPSFITLDEWRPHHDHAGIDAHKRTHTVVAVDEIGCELGARTTTAQRQPIMLSCCGGPNISGAEWTWAVEDRRHLLAIVGVGALTAAKIVAEVADIRCFRSKDAFARHDGTAPLPVWSSNQPRHRLSRTGNRQLNAAIHRIAITQARSHPEAQAYLAHRAELGNTPKEAGRAFKRRLSDIVYRALLADAQTTPVACLDEAG